jgi:PAS domain S-box-containing protein
MNPIPRSKVILLIVTLGITFIIFLTTIFSLKSGLSDIFPYFYLLPILLLAYTFPRYSVYFTIILGWIYLGLVYLYGNFDIRLYAASSAWFYIFVTIGVLLSSKIEELNQGRKYKGIFTNSQAGIFTFDREQGIITEINEKAAQMLGYETTDLRNVPVTLLWPDTADRERLFSKLDAQYRLSDVEMAFARKDHMAMWGLLSVSAGPEAAVVCSVVDITERKKMKDVLDESELRYRTLFDFASDAILIHDLDGRIFEANRGSCELFELSRERILSTTLHEIDPEAFVHMQEMLIRTLHPTVTTFVETEHKNRDGRVIPLEISSRPIPYRSGSAIISILRDVSGQRKAREALVESEKRYRTLVNQLPDYILVHREGVIQYVNPPAALILGYDPSGIVGMTLDRFISPLSMPVVASAMKRRKAGEPVGFYEITILARDGSQRAVIVKGVQILYDGAPATLNVLTDITELRQAEEALYSSEERYRKVGDLIQFGVWMADADGDFTYLSQSFLDLLEMPFEGCLNAGWMKRLAAQDRERTATDWKQCIRSGGFWDYEYRITSKAGKDTFVLSRGAPIYDSRGKITSWAGIHFDITDLRLSANKLEASLREKEIIIKEVHHRVKNNMQVISGFLLLQSQYITDPKSVQMMEDAQQRVKTMALVHERLYQSRSLEFIDAADYIKSLIADLLNSSTLTTAVETEVNVDHINITLDMAIPIGLIINELVTNSLKHAFAGRPQGKLTVSLRLGDDHRINLIASDDGIGLPADYSERSMTTLGTQLVKVLVGQLGGKMTVESSNGTKFIISFPEKF